MSEIDSGGMAFPVTPTDRSGQIGPTEYGLTKRERCAKIAEDHALLLNSPGEAAACREVAEMIRGGQDGK